MIMLTLSVCMLTGIEYRYLRTHPDIQSEAKDRSGVLDVLEPPDLTHIFNKILNNATKE